MPTETAEGACVEAMVRGEFRLLSCPECHSDDVTCGLGDVHWHRCDACGAEDTWMRP